MLQRSTAIPHPPDRNVSSTNYVMLTDCEEPPCYCKAMLRHNKLKWGEVAKSQMDSLAKTDTCDLVSLSKHIYMHYHVDDSISKESVHMMMCLNTRGD